MSGTETVLREKQASRRSEKILIVSTVLLLILLSVKSLWIDGFANRRGYDAELLERVERSISLSTGIISEKVITAVPKEDHIAVRTRRYLLFVLPIGDRFIKVELDER